MKEIALTKGAVAVVDDEDYDELTKHRWNYSSGGYAIRTIPTVNGKRTNERMHAVVMGKKDGFEIDHINGNKLDNRRCNLRHVTHRQNAQNKKSRRNSSSKYKGVTWLKKEEVWISHIVINGKDYHLGRYKSERDAAWVYNVWAQSFFGEYARPNILEEEKSNVFQEDFYFKFSGM